MIFLIQDNRTATGCHIKKSASNGSSSGTKKTLTRTRRFVIDGVTFTTTTSKVIYGDRDSPREDLQLRFVLCLLVLLLAILIGMHDIALCMGAECC